MENKILYDIDQNFFILISIHALISIVIALFLARYVQKRFIKSSYAVNRQDLRRLQEIVDENKIYKILFHFSLHKNNPKSSFLYFFVFNFSMPILGYVSSILLAKLMIEVKYEAKVSNTNMLNLDEFGISFLEVERVFGEGSLNDLIHSPNAPKAKKLRALNVLSSNISPANLRIIKQTLSSTDDEIRMYGYAIIDKAEKRLSKSINIEIEKLQNSHESENVENVANSAKELAFLYWELLYTELSHDSLNDEFLSQVEKYALIARRHYLIEIDELKTQDQSEKNSLEQNLSKIHLLLGRVYMKQKHYERALTEFIMAQELREDDANFVLPYVAEAYFLLGKFQIVGSILSRLQTLEINPTIYPIIEQWKRA